MTRAPTLARLLTLSAVVALLLVNVTLGSAHALSECGVIALVLAIVLTLARCGAHPASNTQAWQSAALAVFITALLWQVQWHHLVAEWLPALVQALLAVLIARTLLPGRVPVIQRIAEAMQPPGTRLPADLHHYTRMSTVGWCGLFTALALLHATIVLWHWPVTTLPLPDGIADVAIIIPVLLLEHGYRRWRYGDRVPHTLMQFCLALRHVNPMRLLMQA